MTHTPLRYDTKTFLIYIDSYENGVPVGQYRNPCSGECGQFQSLIQLLLKLEQCLDVKNIPQSFHKVRTFIPIASHSREAAEEERSKLGKKGTFAVQILFRRNASWQGTVTWLEKNMTQNFRSVLELLILLNSALEEKYKSPWDLPEDRYQDLAE